MRQHMQACVYHRATVAVRACVEEGVARAAARDARLQWIITKRPINNMTRVKVGCDCVQIAVG